MDDETPILELCDVTVQAGRAYDNGLWGARLRLMPRELILIRLERGQLHLPVRDVALGLIDPTAGEARLNGNAWHETDEAEADQLRGNSGCLAFDDTWVSNLDVDENITLAQRHHTLRPLEQIEDEASQLARFFGLPGLPRGRPWQVRRSDLRRAACVRAFLGRPHLLILETPAVAGFSDVYASLINLCTAARGRGAGVLWLSDDSRLWNDRGLRPARRYVMSGAQLLQADSGE